MSESGDIVARAMQTLNMIANRTERIWIYLPLTDWETAYTRFLVNSLLAFDPTMVIAHPYLFDVHVTRESRNTFPQLLHTS